VKQNISFNIGKKSTNMKILKYVLGILGVLLLIFLAVGMIHPSVSYGHEIEVNKPLKESWAVHKDYSKFDQWLDGFKSIEHISGEEEAIGSKYKVIVIPQEGAEPFEMIETLTAMEEFDHITLHFDSDMMDFDQTTFFSEKDGKTTIKTDSKVIAKGMFMRSMFAVMEMMGGSFTAQEAKNIEQLKKVIESNTTDYFPAPVVETVEQTQE